MVTQRQSFNYEHPYIVQGVSNAHCAIRSMVQRFSCINDGVTTDLVCGSAHCSISDVWAQELGKNEIYAYQASNRDGY